MSTGRPNTQAGNSRPAERSTARPELILGIREKQFQAWVIQAAKLLGWRYYHPYDSRKSVPGYPDLTLVNAKQGRVMWVELKAQTGRVSKPQREWLDDLTASGQETHIWRPQDWIDGTIHDLLKPQRET